MKAYSPFTGHFLYGINQNQEKTFFNNDTFFAVQS